MATKVKRQLKAKGCQLSRSLSRLELLSAQNENEDSLSEALAVVVDQSKSMESLQDELFGLISEDEIEKELEAWTELEERKIQLISQTKRLMKKESGSHITSAETVKIAHLEPIKIPKFSGQAAQYEQFRAAFKVFVDENRQISMMEKMIRLRGYLEGEAFQAVEGLTFSESDYQAALRILDKRFGGQDRQMKERLRALRSQNPIEPGDGNAMRRFADVLTATILSLKNMGDEHEIFSETLFEDVFRKLPERDRQGFISESVRNGEKMNLVSLEPWLQARSEIAKLSSDFCDPIDPREPVRTLGARHAGGPSASESRAGKTFKDQMKKRKCELCSQEAHSLEKCQRFKNMTPDERWEVVKKQRRCFGCLDKNHHTAECNRATRCQCNRFHHRLLCARINDRASGQAVQDQPRVATSGSAANQFRVALRTIPVIISHKGRELRATAFLDGGSDTSYLRQSTAEALGISSEVESLQISTLGGKIQSLKTQHADITIKDTEDGALNKLHVCTLPVVCRDLEVIQWPTEKEQWNHLRDVPFQESGAEVDLLIGSDHPELHEVLERRSGGTGRPVAERTPLGWTCVGPVGGRGQMPGQTRTGAHAVTVSDEPGLDNLLRQFWENDGLEAMPYSNLLTTEEKRAVKCAEETLQLKDGRYEVGVPWKGQTPVLKQISNNKKAALSRLQSLEASLLKKPDLREKYEAVIATNLKKGYIRKLEEPDLALQSEACWFIPHFPVVREDKQTTKVRFVMDAAFKVGGRCLNSEMLTGPKLQKDIMDLLVKFRRRPVALVGDIKEMFSQILLKEQDRCFHRFLWRDMECEREPDVYESTRLIFGARASPFLAQKVLMHHAEREQETFPVAARIIKEETYVDDVMTCLETEEEAKNAREELTKMLREGGFTIRRWCSNRSASLDGVSEEDKVAINPESSGLPTTKIMGIQWNAQADEFVYDISSPKRIVYTKRGVLSKVCTIFDPIGFLAPFTIRAKIGIQRCWQEGIGWDESMPAELEKSWRDWFQEVEELRLISIPRCLRPDRSDIREVALHTFTDASEKAFGAVTYIRYIFSDGSISVAFVAAKTRVTPLSATSIPRLELMGAHVGVRLSQKLAVALQIPILEHHFWTDSMNVLSWIKSESRQFKPFVANRVACIQEVTCPSQWRHVPGDLNPADDASRGLSAVQLTSVSRWFTGPEFLHHDPSGWPERPLVASAPESDKEKRKVRMSFPAQQLQAVVDENKFSSLKRLLRITAWVTRFTRNCRLACQERKSGPLTAEELQETERYWVRVTQQ